MKYKGNPQHCPLTMCMQEQLMGMEAGLIDDELISLTLESKIVQSPHQCHFAIGKACPDQNRAWCYYHEPAQRIQQAKDRRASVKGLWECSHDNKRSWERMMHQGQLEIQEVRCWMLECSKLGHESRLQWEGKFKEFLLVVTRPRWSQPLWDCSKIHSDSSK